MDNRDCNQCVYSTREGGCRKFKCEGTKTVEDIKAEAIDELLDAIKKSIISIEVRDRGSDYSTIYNWIEMIAERVKEQK